MCQRMNDSTGNVVGLGSISVFFPCYNEQDNLQRTYESATTILTRMGVEYEIILVDDGSMDTTPKIADAIAAADAKVKVVHHQRNMGYGLALRSGFKAATKSLVFFTDSDGQFSLEELPALLPLMRQYDIISCYRLNRQESFIRRCNAWCWTNLVCVVFGLKIRDINCAFKLYKRYVFAGMELRSTGALINAEIFARAKKRGFKISQVGVHHFPRTIGLQTGANFLVVFRAFWELLTLHSVIKRDMAR